MQLLSDATVSADDASSAGRCAQAMLDGMPQVVWFMRRQMRRYGSRGLSVPQFRTMCLVDRCPTASLSAVAENLGFTLPTASRLVTGMVERKLMTRKACPDNRRQVSLVLTPKGRAALQEVQRHTRERIAEEIAHLTDEQRAGITEAMNTLQAIFARSASAPPERSDDVGEAD